MVFRHQRLSDFAAAIDELAPAGVASAEERR
jgi:hypothetical protein